MMLSEVFWTFLISTVCGVVLATARMCYKSKCKEVDFCCLHIVRDTDAETEFDNTHIERQHSDSGIKL